MDNLTKTVAKYTTEVTEKHIVLFLVVVTTIQIIATLTKHNLFNVNIFQMATMTGLFACIQGTDSVFEYVVGGLIASCLAYASFVTIEKNIENQILLAILRFLNNLIIVAFLLIFDCFNVAALSYALAAPTLIPQIGLGYLISYCVGCVMAISLVLLLSRISPLPLKLKWL